MVTALSSLAISLDTMVRKTTRNIKRVQETTAEVISRLTDYLGSNQIINETRIQDEVTEGSNMAPKKRKAASKRKVRDID